LCCEDRVIDIVRSSDEERVDALLAPRRGDFRVVQRKVARIVEDVRRDGDDAVRRYATELDALRGPIELSSKEVAARAKQAPAVVRKALRLAARHIARVAAAQVPRSFRLRVAAGITVEQRVRPLDRVGCYIPGGRYPLPSTLLMTAVPARVAGVRDVIVVCPRPDATVCAAAMQARISRVFQVGGAQAIAALAFGTATVPRVDKIVGPGNKYVAAAKAAISAECAIDFHAGPTEILIVSERGNPEWLAADLIAQAEHDPDARAVLLTSKLRLAHMVLAHIERQMPQTGPARQALQQNGAIVVTGSVQESLALANRMAPEHLVVDDEEQGAAVACAGSIFIGPYSAQVAGDYAIGANHVLPTGGAARFRGGLHASDFVRVVSVQRLTRRGLKAIGPTATTLARAEGLDAHARSIEMRVR
jgi:histidinol dehydrogenase